MGRTPAAHRRALMGGNLRACCLAPAGSSLEGGKQDFSQSLRKELYQPLRKNASLFLAMVENA